MFTHEEIKLITEENVSVDLENLNEKGYSLIEEKISHRLQKSGFDSNYSITPIGKLCESILDKI